jgi:hypothetical protein
VIALSPKQAADADGYIDQQHAQHELLGKLLFDTFGYDRRSSRVSAQVRNLQQIVCSATRFADIEDFVKNQMGKGTDSAKAWRKVGDALLEQLSGLREKARQMGAYSATRFADIENFVKNQMHKDSDSAEDWRNIGDALLDQLSRLREKSSQLDASPEVQLALRLRLARGWVRGVVSDYLYRIAKDQMEHAHA